MRLSTLALCALALLGSSQFIGTAHASPQNLGLTINTQAENQLQLRQLHVDRVTQLTADGTIHQNVNCWQVVHGSWNGQSLDGLSLVLIKQQGDVSGTATSDSCIYVSDVATPQQRDALVAAVAASNPALFPADLKSIRIEPASIEVEQLDGTMLVLHLARIA